MSFPHPFVHAASCVKARTDLLKPTIRGENSCLFPFRSPVVRDRGFLLCSRLLDPRLDSFWRATIVSDILSQAIDEIERCHVPELTPSVTKALAVMRALHCVLDDPRPSGLERALADLDVSALVDADGWPQIRFTLACQGDAAESAGGVQ